MFEDFKASSICPSGNCNFKTKTTVEHWENYIDSNTGINRSLTDNFSTTKVKRTDLESNTGLRGKKPITKLPSDGTNRGTAFTI